MKLRVLLRLIPTGIFALLFLVSEISIAQLPQEKEDVYVDESGVMRWGHNDLEVKGFGVNYSAPFAHGFRSAQKLGVDLRKAIDNDVYHFSRLDFDLYRIHVWDTEISDAEGNLLENEHLELFDHLLKQLKDRDINFMITPIAYWGNGWPEPDEETPGFSHKYGKRNSLTNAEAIKAQENYLAQFLNHVNPYTGVAYKNEPNIIAFEISNEPHHKASAEEVTEFVQKMVTSMRSTGTKKPIFYNVSHSTHLAEAYFNADIQGGTFQWYPTGLGFQKELEGNLLPNVNAYIIPFNDVIKENNAAKLVYEFDAADVMKSYMYPAMARSFREAGIQIATHFAWDPTYMAHANTEYNTHYMNLAYTPSKALALMISGKIFHEVPMNTELGTYPQNLKFDDFEISYEEDLGVYNSEEEFIYTNDNSHKPKDRSKLRKLAGVGSSELVNYEGNGAYFLDKIDNGVWRLEVMPDAILVKNPFGKNNLEKTVAVINWGNWEMTLNLPGLKENFSIETLNEGNDFMAKATGKSFRIEPGTYLLKNVGVSDSYASNQSWKTIKLGDFFAPETTVEKIYVRHEAIKEVSENSPLDISAEIVSNEPIEKVEVWFQNGAVYESAALQRDKAFTYKMSVPENLFKNGFLKYRIIVFTSSGSRTFPANGKGNPGEWDFYETASYITRIQKVGGPLYLFNAATDSDYIVGEWRRGNQIVPGTRPGEAEYQVRVEELFREDEENLNAAPVYDYSFRYNFQDKIKGRSGELSDYNNLIVSGRSLSGESKKIQVAFVNKNGASFGEIIELQPGEGEYVIKLSNLQSVKTVTLPRPYPSFLPYYFEHNNTGGFDLNNAEAIQVSIGPGLEEEEVNNSQEIGITSFRLEE
ncbi:cellulase family glycosylhydrolase [Gillisia sp. Q332]|uniref:cellulase family glycosylhydrolase n=1 Tax=Gillisia xinjiangensis TaxID=3384765 RepID=UPI00391A4778